MEAKKYVVTYRSEFGDIGCQVMSGQEVANMYGFADCSGEEIICVWEVNVDGSLTECETTGNVEAPFNWLLIFNPDKMSDAWYEWPEH